RGDPSVSFNPFLGIEISDLTISDPMANEGDPPLLDASKVQAQLEIIPALFGQIKISQYLLVRPRLNLKVYSDGNSNWHFKQGDLHDAYRETQDSLQSETSATPVSAGLGTFLIDDGTVSYEDAITGQTENITSINGTILWPSTDQSAKSNSTAIWRGEIVASQFELSKPLELMAGGETDANISFESAPAAIEFRGSANMLSDLFVKGEIELNTPSLRRFSEFFVTDFTDFYLPGTIDLSGEIEATGDAMRLTDAQINIAGHNASGVISLGWDEVDNASIDGTLAFDTIDLSSFIEDNSETIEQLTAPGEAKGIKVDLRISANSIDVGFLELSQVAAAVNVAGDNWTFDVGDSQTLGGNLIARIGERQEQDGPLVLMEVTATDVDAASVSELFPERLIGMTGKGNFNASLRSKTFAGLLGVSGLNGSLTTSLENGSITGIDIPFLLSRSNDKPIGAELGDKTDFQNARFNFFISNGIASISQSTIDGEQSKIQMIGRVDLRQGNLALRAQEITDGAPEPERLFIGGTLKAPLVSLKKSQLDQTGDPETEEAISN
ncbi:MAG: AsmA family protein, partial [Pseudomonadota bacterium]